ncbi:molybdenum cofactor biosynthesis protein MoaE [Lentibacter sp. XHP0401]|uniref:molybdenum cofactor biosynthesis protein MoaE n=1 Tax=Lentibacter sp. XHP0401 TaxID=2984334 RepID=UPI0021E8B826|nr:molybdenum cofactor biosynthesis protein MoaE [Lentibacter sp. XHP0401]MCV2892900.1 molybdenum cofactor biosynthesis protein MoaE [Lentibacter sp. XHP0401]
MDIRVQENPFDLGQEASTFSSKTSASGAVVTFTGIVRDNARNSLDYMDIEHYPGMTESALRQIADDALTKWSLEDAMIIHRIGKMRAGEMIMMVATAARHRKDAFEAAEFLMDFLKSRAPFWKKEVSKDGSEWVDARDEDEAALTRWQK